jgi:23S rRNA pseudouridine1911/1915/1917 synthase
MAEVETLCARIPKDMAGLRLDQALARLFPAYSRARLQAWVRAGHVRIDSSCGRPRDRVNGGELVELRPFLTTDERWVAQPLPLTLVYEDADIMVIDKAPGIVVHPGAGNPDGTLVNALLHHAPELAVLPRAGIVHRIDKDTSGLLVVARRLEAHQALVRQLKEHAIVREYQAIVTGVLTAEGRIDAPVGRHPTHRIRMAVVSKGKPAATHYRVAKRFRAHTLVRVRLETGRTHQVRVHMAHIGHPLVGDPLYGGRLHLPPACGPRLAELLRGFRRQALHACRLTLHHPVSGQTLSWESLLPQDMSDLLDALATEAAKNG